MDAATLVASRPRAEAGAANLQPALAALRARADTALAEPLVHVTQKPREFWPASGDPHDYVSAPRFAWPDPKNPKGAWQNIDGKPNDESARQFAGPRIASMTRRVIDLGQSW